MPIMFHGTLTGEVTQTDFTDVKQSAQTLLTTNAEATLVLESPSGLLAFLFSVEEDLKIFLMTATKEAEFIVRDGRLFPTEAKIFEEYREYIADAINWAAYFLSCREGPLLGELQ